MTPSAPAYPPIFDGHNDTILSLNKTGRSFFDRSEDGHIDLPRAREGGLGGGFFAVYICADESTWPERMSWGHRDRPGCGW
jgi:membrane dipeptidase